MIPIGDKQPRSRTPIITYLLIGLNVLFFLVQLGQGPQLEAFIARWGAVPARLAQWPDQPLVMVTLATSIFLHGGWFHLIGNMLYLAIFGDNVEDRMGHVRFLAYYLFGGIVAGLVQLWFTPGSPIPAIGASGAVAAVLGAYVILYPRAQVLVLLPIFIFFQVIAVPAVLALGFWFVSQFFNGLFSLAEMDAVFAGGVAWWAHIGGFVVGIVVGLLLRGKPSPPQRRPQTIYDYTYP